VCVVNKENEEEDKAMLADRKLVEDLLEKSTSKSLKTSLPLWMKRLPEVSEEKLGTSTRAAAKKRKS
jgi:hypothetical protein